MSELHLVCPSCGAVNRAPPERLAQGPSCGRCKQALLPGAPMAVDGALLDKLVTRGGVPVVVDFWAGWCGPCRAMAPAYASAAQALKGRAIFAKLDTEAHQQAAARHGIASLPTLALFRGGREAARTAGAMPAGAIVDWVKRAL